jgi:hypothetical protein
MDQSKYPTLLQATDPSDDQYRLDDTDPTSYNGNSTIKTIQRSTPYAVGGTDR